MTNENVDPQSGAGDAQAPGAGGGGVLEVDVPPLLPGNHTVEAEIRDEEGRLAGRASMDFSTLPNTGWVRRGVWAEGRGLSEAEAGRSASFRIFAADQVCARATASAHTSRSPVCSQPRESPVPMCLSAHLCSGRKEPRQQ